MADRIATGEIQINLNDREAMAGLHRLKSDFDRTMSDIGHQRAVATVDAQLAPFEDKIANAKRELKILAAQKAEVTVEADAKRFEAKIKEVQAQITKLEGEKATVELEVKGERNALNAIRRVQKAEEDRAKSNQKAEAAAEKITAQSEAKRLKAVENQARVSRSLEQQRLREMRDAESTAHSIEQGRQRDLLNTARQAARVESDRVKAVHNQARVGHALEQQRVREMRQAESDAHRLESQRQDSFVNEARRLSKVADLQQQYSHAVQAVERQNARSKPIGREARAELQLDRNAAVAKMHLIKAELERIGSHPPVDISVDVDRHGKAANALGRFADAIATTTVRVGPFSTTVLGLIRSLSLMGPIVIGLVGQIGALGAVVGSAAVGAFGVLSAAAVGFAGAAIGIFAVVRPIIMQFKEATKATKAYQTAVDKYGASSKQAKLAQQQLNSVLAHMSPQVREQMRLLPQISAEWKRLTAPANSQVWKLVGSGIKTVNALLPLFARNTNAATAALSRGFRDMLGGLRSREGQSILGNLFAGFTNSLPSIMHALGQLGAAAGRFLQPFAALLPMLTAGFDRWATSLGNASKNGSRMAAIADRTVGALRSLGHVTAAVVHVLDALVTAGTGPGTNMLERWATGLNKLAASMSSVQGQRGLTSFFDQSIATANKFWRALAPIGKVFFEWTTILRPFTDAGLVVVRILGQLVQAVAAIAPLKAVLQGVFAAYLFSAFGNRVKEAVTGVRDLTGALVGLRVAQAATTTGGGAATALVGAGAAASGSRAAVAAETAVGAEAAVAGRQVGVLRAAATAVVPAIAGLGAVAGGIATIGIGALAAAAIYGAYKLLTMKDSVDKVRQSINNVNTNTRNLRDSTNAYADSVTQAGAAQKTYTGLSDAVAASKKRLNDLDAHGKRNTKAFADETNHLTDLLSRRQSAESQLAQLTRNNIGLSARVQVADRNKLDAQTTLNKALDQQKKIENERVSPRGGGGLAHINALARANKDVADAQKAVAAQTRVASEAENTMAAAGLNVQRVLKGMIPLAGSAAQTLGKLAQTRPAAALKIATKFEDPKDAARVATQAQRSLGSGVKIRTVMQIVADSSNAQTAVARLKAIRLDPKTLSILQKGGDAAVSMLEAIKGRKLTPKEQKIAQRGGAGVLAIVGRILGIRIPNKNFAVSAVDHASGVIRSIQGVLNGLANKTVTVTTLHNDIANKLAAKAKRASGRGAIGPETALVGEGGGPEILANQRTGAMRVVTGPSLANLNKDDFVIPTEPKHRARGGALLELFAKSLGIPGFARGKNPPLSPHGAAVARNQAKSTLKHKEVRNAGAYTEIAAVTKLQQDEADQSARINVAESKLQEPASFLVQTGTDAQGNELWAIDQGAINSWVAKLNNIRDMYNALLSILTQLQTAVAAAVAAVTSTIGQSDKNIGIINTLEKHDQSTAASNKVSKAERQAAQQRLKIYDKEKKRQESMRTDASNSRSDLKAEQQYTGVPNRIDVATVARDQYVNDAAAVQGKAQADLVSSTPPPAAAAGAFDALLGQAGGLDAESALTAIGQGTRTPQAVISDQIAVQQRIIDTAKGLLSDNNPGNDADANSAIVSAAGAIQGFQGALPNLGTESKSLGSARGDLFRTMGSNFVGLGAGDSLLGSRPGIGAFGSNSAAMGNGGGTSNTVNNYFQTQPADPHTWSKGVLFELQAAS